jgi:hypothetical protein
MKSTRMRTVFACVYIRRLKLASLRYGEEEPALLLALNVDNEVADALRPRVPHESKVVGPTMSCLEVPTELTYVAR